MANSNIRFVAFENRTDKVVCFLMEIPTQPARFRFVLEGRGSHDEPVPSRSLGRVAITDEKLRLVDGPNATGNMTNEVVGTGELDGLDQVVIIQRQDGSLCLERIPRKTSLQKFTDILKGLMPGRRGQAGSAQV